MLRSFRLGNYGNVSVTKQNVSDSGLLDRNLLDHITYEMYFAL